MKFRLFQALFCVIAVLCTALAAVLMLFVPAEYPFPKWGVSSGLLIVGLMNFCFVPLFPRERMPNESAFVPVQPGGPVVGNAAVRRMAAALQQELAGTPHEIMTSTSSIRVNYDSGELWQPGPHAMRRFTWRTTLIGNRKENVFTQIEQQFSTERRAGWKRSEVQLGKSWSVSWQGTVDRDGIHVTKSASTTSVHSAISRAARTTGATISEGPFAVIGMSYGALGILIAIGATIGGAIARG